MQIHLVAVGTRVPGWVKAGFDDYSNRLPRECSLQLTEIAPGKRGKTPSRALHQEEERMLAAIPQKSRVIALEVTGQSWDTAQLARQLQSWLSDGRDVTLLVGGPDGLTAGCRHRAEQYWSLSPLTFPHALVRIMVAEQLYRAWSILNNHPYHRA